MTRAIILPLLLAGQIGIFPTTTSADDQNCTYDYGELIDPLGFKTSVSINEGSLAAGIAELDRVEIHVLGSPTDNPEVLNTPEEAGSESEFGTQCAWCSDGLLVSAPGALGGGAVHLFKKAPDGSFQFDSSFLNPEPSQSGFGSLMAVDGDLLTVVAQHAVATRPIIHIYRRLADGNWISATSVGAPEGSTIESLAVSNNVIAAGFPDDNEGSGLVICYEEDSLNWSEAFRIEGEPAAQGRFGSAVDWIGDELWVGAPDFDRGAVKRFLPQVSGAPQPLSDLEIPDWVEGAGSSIARTGTGQVAVGAPRSSFVGQFDQGAVLIYDLNEVTWKVTDVVANNLGGSENAGKRVWAGQEAIVFQTIGFNGESLQTLFPGPRLETILEPHQTTRSETDSIAQWTLRLSRPVNRSMMISSGLPTGTATEAIDYIGLNPIEFVPAGAQSMRLRLLPLIDQTPEADEALAYADFRLFGADAADMAHPHLTILEAESLPSPLPTRITARLQPEVQNGSPPGLWETPRAVSLSNNELILVYPDLLGDRSVLRRYLRSPEGKWEHAQNIDIPDLYPFAITETPTVTHDEQVLLAGGVGLANYSRIIKALARTPDGSWTPLPDIIPLGGKQGSFGKALLLEDEWVFATRANRELHIFRRTDTTFQDHSFLVSTGLPIDPSDNIRTFGSAISWNAPYLAVSLQRAVPNAQSEAGIAVFEYDDSSDQFTFEQLVWTGEIGGQFRLFGWLGDDLAVSHSHGTHSVRIFARSTAGNFEERKILTPENSASFGPVGRIGGDQVFLDYQSSGFSAELLGYQWNGSDLSSSLAYSAPFPGLSRAHVFSNLNGRSEIAFVHTNGPRPEVYVVTLDGGRPVVSLTLEDEVDSDQESIAIEVTLDPPPHLPVLIHSDLEGLDGAEANRDFIPQQRNFVFEIGDVRRTSSFGLLDNPAPAPAPVLVPRIVSGGGAFSSISPTPSHYRKVRSAFPRLNQRITVNPGENTGLLDYAFDGESLLLRQIGFDPSRFASRRRIGRVFETTDRQDSSFGFPVSGIDSDHFSLLDDILLLGRPGGLYDAKSETIQLGRSVQAGEWSLGEPIASPTEEVSSLLGKHVCRNDNFLVITQRVGLPETSSHLKLLAYDLQEDPIRLVGSRALTTITSDSIGPMIAIDDLDRVFCRHDNGSQLVLSISKVTTGGIAPAGEIVPTDFDPGNFGFNLRCHGGLVFAGNYFRSAEPIGAGAVHVFEESAEGWNTKQLITSPDGVINGAFGISFDVENDWLVVGEPGRGSVGNIYFFRYASGAYQPFHRIDGVTNASSAALTSPLGGQITMGNGCILASASESNIAGSPAIYSIDLTSDESFPEWCSRWNLNAENPDEDRDGDGLSSFMEWSRGSSPNTPDKWWGYDESGFWLDSSGGLVPSVRMTVECSENLKANSWTEIATRVGTEPWRLNSEARLRMSAREGQRIESPRSTQRRFYRLTARSIEP